MKYFSFILILVVSVACQNTNNVKIACVGDSITEGALTSKFTRTSYPMQLQEMLGNNYEVLNAGRVGATMLRSGNLPYWNTNDLQNTFRYRPDIIILKLGTNDTKPNHWDAELFKEDYQAMVDTLNTISSSPKIYLCIPVPVFKSGGGINDSILTTSIIPIIKEIAHKNELPIIDAYSGLLDCSSSFPDGIHPNDNGAKRLAEIVKEGLGI
ncbi:MAG: GDSL-type esterase/lipase family protein [Mangrovibacterium sp.]